MAKKDLIKLSNNVSGIPQVTISRTKTGAYIERFNAALVKKGNIQNAKRCIVLVDKVAKNIHFEFTEDESDGHKITKQKLSSLHITASLATIPVKPGKYPAYQNESEEGDGNSYWFIKY